MEQPCKAEMVQTSVQQQRKGSISLKTTVPEGYVTMLRLKPGDRLDWDHQIVDGEVILKIRKAKQ